MSKDGKSGFLKLALASLSALTTSVSMLFSGQHEAVPVIELEKFDDISTYEKFQNKILKTKLVLKQGAAQILTSMHVSHKSHSSHRSHSSHASHSSSNHSSHSSHASSSQEPYTPPPSKEKESLPVYVLGSRTLMRGDEGTDVLALQKMLDKLGYTLYATGYFGDNTEDAVKLFQQNNNLSSTGIVDSETLSAIKSK